MPQEKIALETARDKLRRRELPQHGRKSGTMARLELAGSAPPVAGRQLERDLTSHSSPPIRLMPIRFTTFCQPTGPQRTGQPGLPGLGQAAAPQPQWQSVPAGRSVRPQRVDQCADVECQRERLSRPSRTATMCMSTGPPNLFQGNMQLIANHDPQGPARRSRRSRLRDPAVGRHRQDAAAAGRDPGAIAIASLSRDWPRAFLEDDEFMDKFCRARPA